MRGEGCLCFCGGSREPLADLPAGKVQLSPPERSPSDPTASSSLATRGRRRRGHRHRRHQGLPPPKIDVKGVNAKIASLLGVPPIRS